MDWASFWRAAAARLQDTSSLDALLAMLPSRPRETEVHDRFGDSGDLPSLAGWLQVPQPLVLDSPPLPPGLAFRLRHAYVTPCIGVASHRRASSSLTSISFTRADAGQPIDEALGLVPIGELIFGEVTGRAVSVNICEGACQVNNRPAVLLPFGGQEHQP